MARRFLKNTSAAVFSSTGTSSARYEPHLRGNTRAQSTTAGNFSKYSTERRTAVRRRRTKSGSEEVERLGLHPQEPLRQRHRQQRRRPTQEARTARRKSAGTPARRLRAPMTFPPASRTGDIVFRIEGLKKAGDRITVQRVRSTCSAANAGRSRLTGAARRRSCAVCSAKRRRTQGPFGPDKASKSAISISN